MKATDLSKAAKAIAFVSFLIGQAIQCGDKRGADGLLYALEEADVPSEKKLRASLQRVADQARASGDFKASEACVYALDELDELEQSELRELMGGAPEAGAFRFRGDRRYSPSHPSGGPIGIVGAV
ncbi:MAG: hypothetical protein ACYDCC_04755 [Actinomycetota bacterium]